MKWPQRSIDRQLLASFEETNIYSPPRISSEVNFTVDDITIHTLNHSGYDKTRTNGRLTLSRNTLSEKTTHPQRITVVKCSVRRATVLCFDETSTYARQLNQPITLHTLQCKYNYVSQSRNGANDHGRFFCVNHTTWLITRSSHFICCWHCGSEYHRKIWNQI